MRRIATRRRLAVAATAHPISSWLAHRCASITPQTAGTIRYAKVSSTPATRTKATTIRANIDALIYGLLTGGTFGWLWPS